MRKRKKKLLLNHLETKRQIVVVIGLVLVLLLLFPSVASPLISYTATIYISISDIINGPYFFVDNNISDVDSSQDIGTHSNFTAQQHGLDSTYDTLTEGGFLGTNEHIFISGNDDFVRKFNKSDLGGTEILSWDTDTTYPFGIEYQYEDGNEYIFLVDKGVDALIRFDANTGEELTRWTISGYSGDAEGLVWNGSRWFIADRSDDLIYQVDPATPTVAERSFSYSGISYCTGLAWDGSYLWVTDEGSDTVYQIDIYGNIQTSWSFTDPTGIAYDFVSGHLWIISGSTDYLYEYYANGTEINSWDPTGTAPEGVTYSNPDDYQLDLEVQWTNVDYDETNEELAINIQKGTNTRSLDATGGYMIVGNGTPDWCSTTGTISFWIKWDTVGMGTIQPRPWGQHFNLETRMVNDDLWVSWGTMGSIVSNTHFLDGKWYFIAIVWNENTDDLYLYIGDKDNAPTEDNYKSAWTGSVSTVGVTENNFMASSGGTSPTDGHGDDLRYWSIDRTLEEIQSDYNSELSGSETNLRSYFKFNNNFDDMGPDNSNGSGSGGYSFSSDVPFEAYPSENIRVDVWTGSAWQNVFTDLTDGWNNVTISSYLTSATFTIRFKGSTETTDLTQDRWNIDTTLIHVWS